MGKIDYNALIDRIASGDEKSEIDLKAASLYHKSVKDCLSEPVAESTWNDLDMDEVFLKINRTFSAIGAQYLYHEMHCCKDDLDFPKKRFEVYRKFQNDQASSKVFARILLSMREKSSAKISSILFDSQPEKPSYFPLTILLVLLFIVSALGLIFISKQFILGVLAFGLINSWFQQRVAFRISSYIPEMGSLGRMLGTAQALADTGKTDFREIEILKGHITHIKFLQKKFGWLLIDTMKLPEMAAIVVAYINHLLLVNLIVFFSASKYVENSKRELKEIFRAIGSLDSSMAVAGYLASAKTCCPRLVDENRIDLDSTYHPSLVDPVTNSFTLTDHSSLITGSNMAGKTTFIKTIGVNLLLARTLGFSHAESAVFPSAMVLSAIRRGDDLTHGKSYYYVEIETILEFIKASNTGGRYLFLIDEIFRGTNTVERLASASSVLKYLGARGMILVTTHDIELEHMLGDKYKMFHFQEQIEDGRHFFDYRVKPGPCRSRNAIRLLELTGYPDCIISEAREVSEVLSSRGN